MGISSLAFALPLLGTLGEGATFFVAHGAEVFDILLFGVAVYLLPALFLTLVGSAVGLIFRPSAATLFFAVALGFLAAIWAMSNASGMPATGAVALGIAVGILAAWSYVARSGVRAFLTIIGQLSPAILLFFFAFTPVKGLVFPAGIAANSASGGAKIPIVMVVFDELSMATLIAPDGNIDENRVPNFARLERMSTWYRDTTTVSTSTEKAIPAILSGMITDSKTLPTYSEFPQNVFSLLAGSHEIHALETVSRLCPKSLCSRSGESLDTAFDPLSMYADAGFVWLHSVLPAELGQRYLPSITGDWKGFGGDKRTDRTGVDDKALRKLITAMTRRTERLDVSALDGIQEKRFKQFLARLGNSEGVALDYLHIGLPHSPWVRFPDGSIYNGNPLPGLEGERMWREEQVLVDQGVFQYALQLEYVDGLLGELLDQLEEGGHIDETLLIVVSDHGLAFAPGKSKRIPEAETLADVARVPLFVKYPGQKHGKQDLRKVQTIDIFPTIAALLDLPLAVAVDGKSLIDEHWQPVRRHVLEAADNIPDFEAAIDIRQASERINRVLTPGKSAMDSFGSSKSRAFIGKPVSEDTPAAPKGILLVDRLEAYATLDIEVDTLPARLSGSVEGIPEGTEIMVGLNRTFAGSGVTYDDQGSLSVMLDPRLFQRGFNEIAAYILVAGELARLEVAGRDNAP